MKKLIVLVLLMLMVVGIQAFDVGGISYSVLSETGKTVSVVGKSPRYEGDIWIPDDVYYNGENYSVRQISSGAFNYCNITSVRLPGGLEEIGRNAFWQCWSLHSIELPWSLQVIGESAFYNIPLESITIPGSVRVIGKRAFADCTLLTSVNLNAGIEEIGEEAFAGCSKLTSVFIPYSVKTIGAVAFPYSSIESLRVDGSNSKFDSRYNCNGIIESATATLVCACKNTQIPSSVSRLGDYLYRGADFEEFSIPNSVTSLGTGVFKNCGNLKSVSIPASVSELSPELFQGCAFTEFDVSESIHKIGANAFRDNKSLTRVAFPEGLTEIGGSAFTGCEVLSEANLPSTLTTLGEYAFSRTAITSAVIPAATVEIGKSPYAYCYKLKSLAVEEGNAKYDSRDNCNGIVETEMNALYVGTSASVIPPSVTTLKGECFTGVEMAYLEVPETVTSLEYNVFTNCVIGKLALRADVTSMMYVFDGYSDVNSLILSPAVESLREYSLPNTLPTLVLPSNIKQLGTMITSGYAFKSIVCLSEEPIGPYGGYTSQNPFYYLVYDNAVLYVPRGCLDAYKNSDWTWSRFKTIKELPVPSDVNDDGNVNSTDVVSVYNYILNGRESDTSEFFADVNADSIVNSADVVSIYNYIISGE